MIDIIYSYFNQREYTREMFMYINKYIDKSFLEQIIFTVVDDNSDFPMIDYLPDHENLNIKIYRTDY